MHGYNTFGWKLMKKPGDYIAIPETYRTFNQVDQAARMRTEYYDKVLQYYALRAVNETYLVFGKIGNLGPKSFQLVKRFPDTCERYRNPKL